MPTFPLAFGHLGFHQRVHHSDWGRKLKSGCLAVTVLLALTAAGCGSTPTGSGLTVAGLQAKAAAQPGTPKSCPLDYDIGSAAKKAAVFVQTGPDNDEAAVDVETAGAAGKGSALEQAGGTIVECDYQVGFARMAVYTVGVARSTPFSAIGLMMPKIKSAAGLSQGDAAVYANQVQATGFGKATVARTGTAAAVRLPVRGDGDVALVVFVNGAERAPFDSGQLGSLTEALATQANW